jgi:hypothetical protein
MAFFERLEAAFRDITRQQKRCMTCGGIKDSAHRHCVTCRVTYAIQKATWRGGNRRQGLCWFCTKKTLVAKSPYAGLNARNGKRRYTLCEYHLEYSKNYSNARNARLREQLDWADAAE